MIRRITIALTILALVACGGRSASTSAPTPAPTGVKTQVAPLVVAKTLAERLADEAPGERPADPAYERVVPGMAASDIAKLIGRPDEIRERGRQATLHWRTGGPKDPVYVVWLREGVAERMRFRDRW